MRLRNIFSKLGGTLPTAAISALCVAFILLASAMTASGETKDKVPAGRRTVVTAAGATFPLPFYNEAFKAYWQRNSVPVTYAGIGSGIFDPADIEACDAPKLAASIKKLEESVVW